MLSKDFRKLKQQVKEVLEANGYQCSASVHNIDSKVTAFANLRGARVAWIKSSMFLFEPGKATFQIPCVEIREFHRCGAGEIEIALEGRNAVCIRGAVTKKEEKR